MRDKIMIEAEEFVRKFGVIREKQFALFLGAGASASSNIPTAGEMIWDFKRRLYSANVNVLMGTVLIYSCQGVKDSSGKVVKCIPF